jgi:D-alanyl-lipoteichoic acid acyltransferase DltB (MBOAT superfamily)
MAAQLESKEADLAPNRPLKSILGTWDTTIAKCLLCIGGIWLLYATSRTVGSVLVLVAIALLSYGAARLLANGPPRSIHKVFGRCAVPVGLVLVVLLNLFGVIGTLTGAQETIAFSSPLLVAFPFYILSASAFLTDISIRRLAMPKLLDYFTYLVLPFKLLAGPLDTPDLLAQIKKVSLPRSWLHVAAGWPWLTLGLFMKYVIANRLNPGATLGWTDPLSALYTAVVFELKFYFDFAGYSFMGYGGALACGLRITRNFAHPFFAGNVVLFWRRWHVSLGRYLTRYLLEPNVMMFKSKLVRMIFTSSIFLASAMWHGGTGNYLLWGLFHGIVYFSWTRWMKKKNIPVALGIVSMLAFFVLGRFLAIDANFDRLLLKIVNLFDPHAWMQSGSLIASQVVPAIQREWAGLSFAAAFLAFEGWSLRQYGVSRPYHAFRRPIMSFVLFLAFLLVGTDQGVLLYARI